MTSRRTICAVVLLAQISALRIFPQPQTSASQSSSITAPLAPGESLPNLDQVKNQLRQYHDCTCTCGCYARDLDLQADRAMAFLRKRASSHQEDQKLAVVLDIDETTLSNYQEMLQAGFAYNAQAFNSWVESAQAPAIPGTLQLVREAARLHVHIFFLTGRAEEQRAATEKNLRAQGFDQWSSLILRRPKQKDWSALKYKSEERARIQAAGYRIILNVGDQWSDLRGIPEAEYSVKYPDPYYFLR